MSFSVLPPEINSLRLFSGAGSAPMLAAAGAWAGLADELGLAAESFASVTGSLVDQVWQGAAASAMAAAAVPYAGWLGEGCQCGCGGGGAGVAVHGGGVL
ncbi:PPE domain-containing protein, partial [Mycobacterium asiaticum]|uniref:PPE domain-containing protein n=1 Tax=Mycobacterium asiaticum TaxID=1790 RepID=UPI000ADDE3F4